MLALAFAVGIYLARKRAETAEINPRIIMDLGVYVLLSSIIGARLLYVISNLNEYKTQPLEIIFSRSGFVFYGGLILATIVTIWYLNRNKLSIGKIADVIAPSIAIGHAIGRIGCFLNGCCYGKQTTLPWGVMMAGRDPLDLTPLHPTQLYSSAGNLIIFFVLTYLWKRRRFDGEIFLLYLILYSLMRFIIEFYRADNPYILFNLTLSQLLSIVIFIGALCILRRKLIK
jgi:phosphatidylglycerol:prolipoprotein diacylglycerol transferase